MGDSQCHCRSIVQSLPDFVADHSLCGAIEMFGNQSHRAALNLSRAKEIAGTRRGVEIWSAVAESEFGGSLLVRLLWAAYSFHAAEPENPEYSLDLALVCAIKRYMLDDRTIPIFEGALTVLLDARQVWLCSQSGDDCHGPADLVCMLNALRI